MCSKYSLIFSMAMLAECCVKLTLANEGDLQATGEGWMLARRIEDVDIYRRSVSGSSFPAFMASTRIDAPVSRVFEVISDYDSFVDFIPSVSESRVLERNDAMTRVYQRLDMPVLFADRHYVIETVNDFAYPKDGSIRVSWSLDQERTQSLTSEGSAVPPDAFSGSWLLAESPDGSGCDAVYSIHVEPGGRIPAWLFSRATERYVSDVIEAVRKRAR